MNQTKKIGMVDAVKLFIANYFNFSGRASRSEYWWFYLFTVLMSWGSTLVSAAMFNYGDPMGDILPSIVSLAFIIPAFAAGSRRLHDIGKSGWWQLLYLLPIIGWILLIIWFATKTKVDEEKYGKFVDYE